MAQGVCFVWRRNPPVAYGDSPPNSGALGIEGNSQGVPQRQGLPY